MGQRVSVDSEHADFRDVLGAVSESASLSGPPFEHDLGHHMRVWKFERRGQAIIDSPVELCREKGMFGVEPQSHASYLIWHIWATDEEPASGAATAALAELGARAAASCTPRGLNVEVSTSTHGGDHADVPERPPVDNLASTIFLWHGVGVEPFVKAQVLAKAFELERALRGGLTRTVGFWDSLRRPTPLDDVGRHAPPADERREAEHGDSVRRGRNKLLNVILNGTRRGSELRSAGRHDHASSRAGLQRFPRLGLLVLRSLGEAVPSASHNNAVGREQRRPRAGTQPQPQHDAHPPSHSLVPPSDAMAPSTASAPRAVGGGVVPRLNLSACSHEARNEACQLPLSVEPDDVNANDVRGRKRDWSAVDIPLGVSSARAPTALSIPSTVGSTAVPNSARLEIDSRIDSRESTSRKGVCPLLNLAALDSQRPRERQAGSPSAQAHTPHLTQHLEEIHTPSDKDFSASFDPENEENNFHMPRHLFEQLRMKHYRSLCSEILPAALYLASYQVASDRNVLHKHGITHVVNTAADVCDSCFPDEFSYVTYYLKDGNSEKISVIFYRTLEWIHSAITEGGRVLVHCREGVSRSATIVMAYLMWRFRLSYEDAHEKVRRVRPICNPNAGFTFQLLVHAKRLGLSGGGAPSPPTTPQVFRVGPYHHREPFLIVSPVECASDAQPTFDRRFGWVVQRGQEAVLWLGSRAHDAEAVRLAVQLYFRRLETFERYRVTLTVVREGEDNVQRLWQVLNLSCTPKDGPLVSLDTGLDADAACLQRAPNMAAAAAVAAEARWAAGG